MSKIRLQKFLSQNNICSRRKAEELIKDGAVKINNKIAQLGDKVDDSDNITVNNESIKNQEQEMIYIVLNKPIGYTCTKRSFKDEKNIYELLPKELHHLNSVGRLDKISEGLLILTNDGEYLYKMTHPKFEQEKEYIVEVSDKIDEKILNEFKNGIDIEENDDVETDFKPVYKESVSAKSVKLLSSYKFTIVITQGKKRQIRRMCKAVGLRVVNLKRVGEGKIKLGNLKTGKWKKIKV